MTDYKDQIKKHINQDDIGSAADFLTDFCHGLSSEAGWWDDCNKDDPNVKAAKMMLIVSEVSEALEGMRKDIMDDHLPIRS